MNLRKDLILKTFTAEQTNAVEVGGRKIIKAGSVFPKNETGAKGIVYEEVDMTDDEKRPISVSLQDEFLKTDFQ